MVFIAAVTVMEVLTAAAAVTDKQHNKGKLIIENSWEKQIHKQRRAFSDLFSHKVHPTMMTSNS